MRFTRLGSTGTTVSRICLGMMTYGSKTGREWALEEAEARPLIKRAVDLGFAFFDTADDDAVKALDLKLDAEELKALAEPYRPHPFAATNSR